MNPVVQRFYWKHASFDKISVTVIFIFANIRNVLECAIFFFAFRDANFLTTKSLRVQILSKFIFMWYLKKKQSEYYNFNMFFH